MRHHLPFESLHHLLEGVDWNVVQLYKPIMSKLICVGSIVPKKPKKIA